MNSHQQVRVWDPAVRLFHWGLAGSFLVAYVVEDHWLDLHVLAGYTALALIAFRLIWGMVGTRHARFSDFVRPPREVFTYLRDVVSFRAPHYVGHNPAGGAMVLALLALVVLTGITGLATYGAQEFAGPLAGLTAGLGHDGGEFLEETHEVFANLTLLMVFLHLAGVAVASLQHRENLVWSMVTGNKRKPSGE